MNEKSETNQNIQTTEPKFWYVYMIRCEDNSIYTGITTDLNRRYNEHEKGVGAKYTKQRKPVQIEKFFWVKNRSEASRLEWFIKKLSKKEKEFIIFCEKNQKNFIKNAEIKLNIKINL